MTKKRSKSLFVVFAIILALLLVACFVNFTYPLSIFGNYYSYSNFVSNLSLGQDVGSSVRILYRATQRTGDSNENYDELKQSTINQLIDIAQSYGYYDVTATAYGSDGILMQIGNINSKQDVNTIETVIGKLEDISFSTENDTSKSFAFAKDVKSVTMQEGANGSATTYYFTITFNNPDEIYKQIEGKQNLYAFLGESVFMNLNISSIDESVFKTSGITFSNDITNRTDADRFVNLIHTGMLDLKLTPLECTTITPSYGAWATISVAVVSAIVVLAMFIFLIVKYKHIGWVACFNLLFFITISLFIMQSIPILHLNFSGILAMLICFILVADMLIAIIEKAKQHYNEGTQIYISFNIAKKETWLRILITLSLLFVAGLAAVFMPALAIQSFGWVMLVLSVVGAFTTLALMRLFINMYLPLNPQKGEKCNFHKGGKNA